MELPWGNNMGNSKGDEATKEAISMENRRTSQLALLLREMERSIAGLLARQRVKEVEARSRIRSRGLEDWARASRRALVNRLYA